MHLLLLVLFKCYFVAALKPVILMPGLLGSQLEARLNKSSTEYKCPLKENWHSLWFNINQLIYHENCFFENFKLDINETDGTTKNREGVEIRCPDFGNTSAIEFLDSESKRMYFGDFVDRLVCMGYKRNQDIRGAPYDFRKAPNEMAEYFDNLTKLIEETYETNDRKRVVMIGHSMGCLNTLYFLNHKDQAWKDKYVEAFIALGGPWHGAVLALKGVATGVGIPYLNQNKFRDAARTMPSVSWLMPSNVAWNSDEILVIGDQRNYTVNDYENFFNDIKFKNGMLLRRNTENLTRSLENPGVKIYCIYSSQPYSTPEILDYRRKYIFDILPHVIKGEGDGIVNLRSLEGCKDWPNKEVKIFKDVEHRSMMRNKDIQNYLIQILYQLNDI